MFWNGDLALIGVLEVVGSGCGLVLLKDLGVEVVG